MQKLTGPQANYEFGSANEGTAAIMPESTRHLTEQSAVSELSIVIPCRNEAGYIGALLDSLLAQSYDLSQTPVYAADFGSTDGTLEILKYYKEKKGLNIEIVPGGYPAKARNNGAARSRSRYILFLDADVWLYEPDFIEQVLRRAEKRNFDCVGTLVRSSTPGWKDRLIWNALTVFMHAYPVMKPFSSGMCIFIRRNAFESLGGFDEAVVLGEDVELTSNVSRQKFGVVHRHVVTTNRRFEKNGYVRTMLKYTAVKFSRKYRYRDHRGYFES